MGRGRAKAKQTKVARQLKYNSGGFDASRLSNELGVQPAEPISVEPIVDDESDDESDPYAAYANYYADDDDEEDNDAEASAGGSQSRRRG